MACRCKMWFMYSEEAEDRMRTSEILPMDRNWGLYIGCMMVKWCGLDYKKNLSLCITRQPCDVKR